MDERPYRTDFDDLRNDPRDFAVGCVGVLFAPVLVALLTWQWDSFVYGLAPVVGEVWASRTGLLLVLASPFVGMILWYAVQKVRGVR